MTPEIEHLNRIFEETGRLERLEGLQLGESGTAALEFTSGALVLFEYVPLHSRLYLFSPLVAAPSDPARRLCLCEAMLQCNFLKLDTGPGELALSRRTDEAVYQVELDVLSLDAPRLGKMIRDLLRQRDECLYTLTHWNAEEQSTAPNRTAAALARSTHPDKPSPLPIRRIVKLLGQ